MHFLLSLLFFIRNILTVPVCSICSSATITAMADRHFCIEKSAREDNTITDTRVLEEEESLAELARLLGSDALTEAALSNAREMRSQAQQSKAQR